jgi:hypothetical protein
MEGLELGSFSWDLCSSGKVTKIIDKKSLILENQVPHTIIIYLVEIQDGSLEWIPWNILTEDESLKKLLA